MKTELYNTIDKITEQYLLRRKVEEIDKILENFNLQLKIVKDSNTIFSNFIRESLNAKTDFYLTQRVKYVLKLDQLNSL